MTRKTPQTVEAPPGWRIMTSDRKRLWATREKPFSLPEEAAGAARTVDGDDLIALMRAISEQESLAACVGVPPTVPEVPDQQADS